LRKGHCKVGAFGVPCHGRAVEFRANFKSNYFKGFKVNRERTTLVVLGTKGRAMHNHVERKTNTNSLKVHDACTGLNKMVSKRRLFGACNFYLLK
jgi:hypothetical protein